MNLKILITFQSANPGKLWKVIGFIFFIFLKICLIFFVRVFSSFELGDEEIHEKNVSKSEFFKGKLFGIFCSKFFFSFFFRICLSFFCWKKSRKYSQNFFLSSFWGKARTTKVWEISITDRFISCKWFSEGPWKMPVTFPAD